MIWNLLHIIDILLWLAMAFSVGYVAFYALVALIISAADGNDNTESLAVNKKRFLILYPAYGEDKVIIDSVKTFLRQDYDSRYYHLAVISDHMHPSTNEALSRMPITLLTPKFDQSTKAKAMQYAISQMEDDYDFVIILDADNVVKPRFLSQLNRACQRGRKGYRAIQCHRCAKNDDNEIALLDGMSEEINNTIFRKAHNYVGLSSALIGSGMCFDYAWFKKNVFRLTTAGEDRELERLLIADHIYVRYEEDILVYDEKVSDQENFQRQRQRWISAQIHSLITMFPHIPSAFVKGDVNYVDKAIQQALVPRSLLMAGTVAMSVVMLLCVPVWAMKWWVITFVLFVSIFVCIPSAMRKRSLLGIIPTFNHLVWKMLKNVKRINRRSDDFTHTEHGK